MPSNPSLPYELGSYVYEWSIRGWLGACRVVFFSRSGVRVQGFCSEFRVSGLGIRVKGIYGFRG